MKIITTAAFGLLCLISLSTSAQTTAPKGFQSGTITLADGSTENGFVKDNLKRQGSLVFINPATGKKKNYDGSLLTGAVIDGNTYTCIHGDFFRVLSNGVLQFLQKSSDVSGKLVYNGTEGSFAGGTTGKPGDYFLYTAADGNLQLVSEKNISEVAQKNFQGSDAALAKANTVTGDVGALKEAVDIYNNSRK